MPCAGFGAAVLTTAAGVVVIGTAFFAVTPDGGAAVRVTR